MPTPAEILNESKKSCPWKIWAVMQVFRQLPEFRQSRVSDQIFRQFDYLWPNLHQFWEETIMISPIHVLYSVNEMSNMSTVCQYVILDNLSCFIAFFSCLHILSKGCESQICHNLFFWESLRIQNLSHTLFQAIWSLPTCITFVQTGGACITARIQ